MVSFLDKVSDGNIARLAQQAFKNYKMVETHCKPFLDSVSVMVFVLGGLAYFSKTLADSVQLKVLFSLGTAQCRKALELESVGHHGEAVARLRLALAAATEATSLQKPSSACFKEATEFYISITQRAYQASKDNDLIYHDPVPPESALDPIAPAEMAVPADVSHLLKSSDASSQSKLFARLFSPQIRHLVQLYYERRAGLIAAERKRVHDALVLCKHALHTADFASLLPLLEFPYRMSEGTVAKLREFAASGGIAALHFMLDQANSHSDKQHKILQDAVDLLQRAELEEKAYIQGHPTQQTPWMVPWEDAMRQLQEEAREHKGMLVVAANSNVLVLGLLQMHRLELELLTKSQVCQNEKDLHAALVDGLIRVTFVQTDLELELTRGVDASVIASTLAFANSTKMLLNKFEEVKQRIEKIIESLESCSKSDNDIGLSHGLLFGSAAS